MYGDGCEGAGGGVRGKEDFSTATGTISARRRAVDRVLHDGDRVQAEGRGLDSASHSGASRVARLDYDGADAGEKLAW